MGPAPSRQLRGFRALAPMYQTPFHAIALEESGITNFKALKGKRVGIGPSGGPPEVFFRGLAEMLSVKATLVAGTPAELAQSSRPLTGHLMEVPRAMIRLENAAPGSLGSTIVAARLPSRAHDAIDPADRRTGNESATFESGRRNPTKRAARL